MTVQNSRNFAEHSWNFPRYIAGAIRAWSRNDSSMKPSVRNPPSMFRSHAHSVECFKLSSFLMKSQSLQSRGTGSGSTISKSMGAVVMGSPLEPQLSFGAFSPTSPLAFGSPTLLVFLPFKVHLVAFSETTWPPGSHFFPKPTDLSTFWKAAEFSGTAV